MLQSDHEKVPLFRDKTWSPRYNPQDEESLERALLEKFVTPEELAKFKFLPSGDPKIRSTEDKLSLIFLKVDGAPRQ